MQSNKFIDKISAVLYVSNNNICNLLKIVIPIYSNKFINRVYIVLYVHQIIIFDTSSHLHYLPYFITI